MAKDFQISAQVCEQLARELVTEQAEMVKHEALVREIKAKLVDGKKQLIKHLIEGKVFFYDGKKITALHVDFCEEQDELRVMITMGHETESRVPSKGLTRKEKELVYAYKTNVLFLKQGIGNDSGIDAVQAAAELRWLKHGIHLTYCNYWVIDLSNATTPGFYNESGLYVKRPNGTFLLEDLVLFS